MNIVTFSPVIESQIIILPSDVPDAINEPFLLHATLHTSSVCPFMTLAFCPVATSQIIRELSDEPETIISRKFSYNIRFLYHFHSKAIIQKNNRLLEAKAAASRLRLSDRASKLPRPQLVSRVRITSPSPLSLGPAARSRLAPGPGAAAAASAAPSAAATASQ